MPASLRPLLDTDGVAVFDGEGGFAGVASGAWQLPATVSQEQHDQASKALAHFERHLAPAPRPEVVGRVMTALAHYYVADIPAAVHKAVSDDWAEDLGEFPAWAVVEAFRQHRRLDGRKPTIAAIRERCHRLTAADREKRDRLRGLVTVEIGPAAAPVRMRPETKAERDARLAGRVAKLEAAGPMPTSASAAVSSVAASLRHKGTEPTMSPADLDRAKAKALADAAALMGEAAE